MQAAVVEASQVHARFGLILARADECLSQLKERERMAQRIRAAQRRRRAA